MEKIRLLRKDEIECKISRWGYKGREAGAFILLYKTARTDMDILDEVFGSENWESDYKEIKGNLYCGIGVWNKSQERMIWKWDCGIESRADAEGNQKKGEASDAFKRAGTKWGIGRELYTAPEIFIPESKMNVTQNRAGKNTTYDQIVVEAIHYGPDRKIDGLAIQDVTTQKRGFRLDPPVDEAAKE